MNLETYSAILRRIYTEPKFCANIEWLRDYGLGAQLQKQWPREEMSSYVMTGRHPNPARTLDLVIHEMPDFDWWEPRYDQPWRRQQFGVW